MKRLLCIVSCMDTGGAETFLMKIYRLLDKSKYQMDFCVSANKKGFYDDEIKKLGGKIYNIPMKSEHPIKSFRAIKYMVKSGNYQRVLRTSQQSLAAIDLLAAKFGGAKKLIYRSSNAGLTGNFISKIINKLFGFLPRMIPNIKIAPSTEAAEFVFGSRSVQKQKIIILHNGLDYEKFCFNKKIREKIRCELEIDDKTILYGHVGRFNVQKNHLFLLDVFKKIHDQKSNSMLILIGNGELEEDIRQKIKTLKIEKNVKILGVQENVNEYLMAMDLMIFPSLFEGMPNVIIEAQATGLKCFASNTITKEANITGLVRYIDLDASIDNWANEIMKEDLQERIDTSTFFKNSGYLMSDVIKVFVDVVMKG